MRAIDSKNRKGTGLALVATLTILGVTLVDLGPISTVREAAARKLIIYICRAFEPVGFVRENGRSCEVFSTGEPREWVPGERIRIDVLVYQPQTGAWGYGVVHTPLSPADEVPDYEAIRVRAAPESPRFEPGPAIASADAVRWFRDSQISAWSWESEIELLPDY